MGRTRNVGEAIRSSRALATAWCLAAMLASTARAGGTGAEGSRTFVERLASFSSVPDQDELTSLAEDLVRLPEALDGYFAITLAEGISLTEGSTAPLTAEQERLLSETALRFPAPAVVSFVQRGLAKAPDERWRRAALELLALHAGASDLSLLATLTSDDQGQPRPELVPCFQEALTVVLRREGSDPRDLTWLANEAVPLCGAIVRAVGGAGDPQGLSWLTTWLDDPELGSAALQEVLRLARRAKGALASETAAATLPLLFSEDPARRRHAGRILGALREPSAIPRLAELLVQGATSGERAMAHAALREITGLELPADSEAWQRWYVEEERWTAESYEPTLARLASEQPAEVVAAVQALACHPLQREPSAAFLSALLPVHATPAVRGEICLALARLGSEASLPALVAALSDDEQDVRDRAHAALLALTNLSLPPDPAAWEDALEVER